MIVNKFTVHGNQCFESYPFNMEQKGQELLSGALLTAISLETKTIYDHVFFRIIIKSRSFLVLNKRRNFSILQRSNSIIFYVEYLILHVYTENKATFSELT